MDVQELQRENEALNDQVKLLVKTERRLYGARRTIEAQLRQLEALTRLAMSAGRARNPAVILDTALQTLLYVLDVDQGLAFLASDHGQPVLTAMRTQPGCEPPERGWSAGTVAFPSLLKPVLLRHGAWVAPPDVRLFLDQVARYFGEPAVIELVAPLSRQSHEPLGVIALRKLEPVASYHLGLVSEADLQFVDLVTTRIEADVENVLLYRKLRSFATELERRVAERTADLAHANHDLARANQDLARSLRQVRETQAQLVEASKKAAILTLVAGLSHELNNPIGVILGYAQALLSRPPPDRMTQRALAAIERQARRCGTMVKALLGFSQERLVTIDSIPAEILLDRLAAELRDEANARGIEISIEPVEDDLPPLLVSTQEMHEALLHLVRNALDATAPGGTVVLHAHRQQRDGVPGIELEVRDNGSGIPHAFLERIFDPFFTTKDPGKGVGLGLPLARQSVESHGGRIDVRSAAGCGTTMLVWLPTATIAAEEPAQPRSAARAEPESAARGQP